MAAEALDPGETLYLPDGRAPLYPPSLSEGAASLLPDGDRPAVLWRLDLDADAELSDDRRTAGGRPQPGPARLRDVHPNPSRVAALLETVGTLRQRRESATAAASR